MTKLLRTIAVLFLASFLTNSTPSQIAFCIYKLICLQCRADGTGNVDVTGNPNCRIFDPTTSAGYLGWPAYVAAHPAARIATNAVPFIVADDSSNWTITNASFGKPGL